MIRPYPKDTKYLVSDEGKVYKNGSEIKLSGAIYKMTMADGGVMYLVDRMVTDTFRRVTNPLKTHIYHVNGDRFDNHIDNLLFVTPEEMLVINEMESN